MRAVVLLIVGQPPQAAWIMICSLAAYAAITPVAHIPKPNTDRIINLLIVNSFPLGKMVVITIPYS